MEVKPIEVWLQWCSKACVCTFKVTRMRVYHLLIVELWVHGDAYIRAFMIERLWYRHQISM
jgi:hypothetical protein